MDNPTASSEVKSKIASGFFGSVKIPDKDCKI